jgi:hypothetical protein
LEDWVPKEIFLQGSLGSFKSKGKIPQESITFQEPGITEQHMRSFKIRKSYRLLEKFLAQNWALLRAAPSPSCANNSSSRAALLLSTTNEASTPAANKNSHS